MYYIKERRKWPQVFLLCTVITIDSTHSSEIRICTQQNVPEKHCIMLVDIFQLCLKRHSFFYSLEFSSEAHSDYIDLIMAYFHSAFSSGLV